MFRPSELSDIIEDLDTNTGAALFKTLDDEKAADVLEEMEDDAKVSLVEELPVEKAADVLEKMPSDEVADILSDMGKEKAEELLDEMDKATSTEVRELMEYPEGTVGSIMTTEFLAFPGQTTVGDILSHLRKTKPESDVVYSVYVVDTDQKLLGVASLRDIVIADLMAPLAKIMDVAPIFIHDTEPVKKLNKLLSKYSLLSVPVVTPENTLIGAIVIDDILYAMLRKKRSAL